MNFLLFLATQEIKIINKTPHYFVICLISADRKYEWITCAIYRSMNHPWSYDFKNKIKQYFKGYKRGNITTGKLFFFCTLYDRISKQIIRIILFIKKPATKLHIIKQSIVPDHTYIYISKN